MESYPWCFHDWRSSARVSLLTATEKCIYRELCDYYWELGALPASEEALFKYSHVSRREWSSRASRSRDDSRQLVSVSCFFKTSHGDPMCAGRNVVNTFFSLESDGQLHNSGIDERRKKVMEAKQKMRLGADKTNSARWGIGSPSESPSESPGESPSLSPSLSPSGRSRVRSPSLPPTPPPPDRLANPNSQKERVVPPPLSLEEWSEPDIEEIAIAASQEMAPKHWYASGVPRAKAAMVNEMMKSSESPQSVIDKIRRSQAAWLAVRDRPKNLVSQELCFFVSEQMYKSLPPASVARGMQRDLELAAEAEEEEERQRGKSKKTG